MSLFEKSTAYRRLPVSPDIPLSVLDADHRLAADAQASQQSQPDYEGHFDHRSQHYSSVSTFDFNDEAHSSTIDITDTELRASSDGLVQQCSFTGGNDNFTESLKPHESLQGENGEVACVVSDEVWRKKISSRLTQHYQRFMRFILRSGRYTALPSHKPSKIRIGKAYSGWRGGCLLAALSATLVLLVNLTFTVWGAVYAKSGLGIATILVAECSSVDNASKVLHYAINALGTLLVAASNYSMQCLSSPTRKEVDDAHSRGTHLNIGIVSLRNLVGWKEKILFWFLVCSTLPLHFFWNSAVFTTSRSLEYNILVVTPKFIENLSPVQRNDFQSVNSSMYGWDNSAQQVSGTLIVNNLTADAYEGVLKRIENKDCINEYGNQNTVGAKYGDLLVVAKTLPKNQTSNPFLVNSSSEIFFGFNTDTASLDSSWICNSYNTSKNETKLCDYKKIAENATTWTMTYNSTRRLEGNEELGVDYCLAKALDTDNRCQLQYSPLIMICVLASNVTKLVCILLLLYLRQDPILATIGDGIASFMAHPDRSSGKSRKDLGNACTPWRHQTFRWRDAATNLRWVISLGPGISFTALVSILLIITNVKVNAPFSIGFGEFSQDATIGIMGAGGFGSAPTFDSNAVLFHTATVANLPQVIVSSIYFAINSIFTSMAAGDEWSRYSVEAKALRTTLPEGLQRSTYWLSLPWACGVPLALTSTVLHFLISQSLFVSRKAVYLSNGVFDESVSHLAVACSPLAALMAVLLGTGILLATISIGAMKLKPCLVAQNNSLVIAAACHRPADDEGGHLKKVRWGAVRHQEGEIPGHCCFTSKDVEMPKIGRLYKWIWHFGPYESDSKVFSLP